MRAGYIQCLKDGAASKEAAYRASTAGVGIASAFTTFVQPPSDPRDRAIGEAGVEQARGKDFGIGTVAGPGRS